MLLRGHCRVPLCKPHLRTYRTFCVPKAKITTPNAKSVSVIKHTNLFVSQHLNKISTERFFATTKKKKPTPKEITQEEEQLTDEERKELEEWQKMQQEIDKEFDEDGNPIETEEGAEGEELPEGVDDLSPEELEKAFSPEEEGEEKKTDFGLTKDQVFQMQKDYVERVLLNAPTTFFLSEQAKNKLVDLYTSDPKLWTVKKLAERFQISQGRVMGIIKLGLAEREMEHKFGHALDDGIHNALYAFVPEQVSEAGHQFEGKPAYKRKQRYKWTFEEPEMNEELLQLMVKGHFRNRDAQKFREQLPEVPPPGAQTEPVVIVPPQISKEKLKQRYLLNDKVQRVYVANLTSKYRSDTDRQIYCIEPDGSVRTVTWEERRTILKKRYVLPKTYSQKIADAFPGDLTAQAEVYRKARSERQPSSSFTSQNQDDEVNYEEDLYDPEQDMDEYEEDEPEDELRL